MFESFGVVHIWTFLAGTVAIILAPGPNSLYVLSTGMRRGVRPGYKAVGGVVAGDAVLMFLAAAGAGSVLKMYPAAFSVMKYAGAVYLAYLGLKILYTEIFFRKKHTDAPARCGRENPFGKALLLSLSNPKAILFFVSFFVQFVNPDYAHAGLSFLILGVIVQVTSVAYLSLLILGGAALAAFFHDHQQLARSARGGVGALFLSFGCRLALTE